MKRSDLPAQYGGTAFSVPASVPKPPSRPSRGVSASKGRMGRVGMSHLTGQWMAQSSPAPGAATASRQFPIPRQEHRPRRPMAVPPKGRGSGESNAFSKEIEELLSRLGIAKIGQEELLLGALLLLLARSGADLTTLVSLGMVLVSNAP